MLNTSSLKNIIPNPDKAHISDNVIAIEGNIVDVFNKRIFPGVLTIANGIIQTITSSEALQPTNAPYILPGFIDAHVHIESSMLVPSEFARVAVTHGTVATVSDPHEIANVLGIEGVRYMIEDGNTVPFHFFFGASPCVPATSFETAGATISNDDIYSLFSQDKLKYLSEMMNYPGVLSADTDVMEKIAIAKSYGLPIDGHAPGLRGEEAKRYIQAGISTDHECYTLEEALDKLQYGCKIIIREGSAAKNYQALHSLIKTHPESVMFCSDDKHPDDLIQGHINEIVVRAIYQNEHNMMDVLQSACINPILHYNLDVGYLQPGQSADCIVVNNLREFSIQKTYIKGQLVFDGKNTTIPQSRKKVINHFEATQKTPQDFAIRIDTRTQKNNIKIQVIDAIEGELVTKKRIAAATIQDNCLISDLNNDILKLAVVNRYQKDAPIATAFIHGFGLHTGALASSVAHDSHNIIAVGVTDEDLCHAVNAVIQHAGGISVHIDEKTTTLPLPIAGIMSSHTGAEVAAQYKQLDQLAKSCGSPLYAPFMTLSFMALLVIPSLKLSDKGLFDGSSFTFTPLIL